MVKSCSAFGCQNEWTPNSTRIFHRFPVKNKDRLNLWLKAVRRQNFTPTANTVICSDHFKAEDYLESSLRQTILKCDAVPSVFEYMKTPFNDTETDIELVSESIMECRTCFQMLDEASTSLQKALSIGMTIQEMLLLFIPEMIKSKSTEDCICGKCMKAIQDFTDFIASVVTIEKRLRSKESSLNQQTTLKEIPSNDSNRSATSIEGFSNENCTKDKNKMIDGKRVNFAHTVSYDNLQKKFVAVSKINSTSTSEVAQANVYQIVSRINQPIKTYCRKKTGCPPTQGSEQALSSCKDLISQTAPVEKLSSKTEEIDIKDEDLYDVNAMESRSPADEIAAGSSYITTVVPSTVSADSVMKHDRVISISVTNEAIANLLKRFLRSKNLPWQSPLEHKRIVFLGNAVPYCSHCKVMFTSQLAFNLHLQHKHPGETHPESDAAPDIVNVNVRKKKYHCPVCNTVFLRSRALRSHVRAHKEYYPYACENCGRKFKVKGSYMIHLENYKRFQDCTVKKCHVCKEMFSKDAVKDHYKTHKTIECVLCKKKFLSQVHYNRHVENHLNNKFKNIKRQRRQKREILCPVCGKLFCSNTGLGIHMSSHSQNRNYKCDKCPKAFKTIYTFKRHVELVHMAKKKYQCSICGKMTKTLQNLEGHKFLKHSDVYTHVCQICGATFKRNDYYKRHLQKHAATGTATNLPGNKKYRFAPKTRSEVPLPCKYCNRKFRYIQNLRGHLLRCHTISDTRYKCQYCNMTFCTKSNRVRHERRHADPKKFELTCKVCYNIFESKKELEIHAGKHKGSARRRCDLCGEIFPSKHLLMNHKRHEHFSPGLISPVF
ncbi:hypothetical protein NQ315_013236 [Exocentrus adspersus]|uniref:Uncharacterized protein n=1 Tax=Exocentrus adspersus TaxID=1586481 RepID=A0AAV8V7J7_9CUCU|nr:hypothetical protein NQ315_013236 [Exocentrus adspersus]